MKIKKIKKDMKNNNMKKVQVKCECWFDVYVENELTKKEIIDIVDSCSEMRYLLDKEGVIEIGDISNDGDFKICNDDEYCISIDEYIWFDDDSDDEIIYVDSEFSRMFNKD